MPVLGEQRRNSLTGQTERWDGSRWSSGITPTTTRTTTQPTTQSQAYGPANQAGVQQFFNQVTSAAPSSYSSNNISSAPSTQSYMNLYNEQAAAADAYINDLMGQAQGDYDFVIKQLKRDHEVALGTDDAARAQFMETVADKLEEQIGRIPYDYEVGTTRIGEDLSRVTDVTNRNKELALSRLAEDEQVWREQFGQESQDTRQSQSEELSQRGLLQGTRAGAEGLAGREVARTEGDLGTTLQSFERALGRTTGDINTQAADTLFEANRNATRSQQDLTTSARRGAIDQTDVFTFGQEGAQRQLDAKKKDLERLREQEKRIAQQSAVTLGSVS